MAKLSFNFERKLYHATKAELIEKFLTHENHQAITQWLLEQHGIKVSKTVLWRYAKTIQGKYERLVNLGMPIKTIVENRHQIEALGIDTVEQTLIEKLKEKSGSLFAYLDETEGSR